MATLIGIIIGIAIISLPVTLPLLFVSALMKTDDAMKNKERKKAAEKFSNSEYVKAVFKFIEFYEELPEKMFLVVTPEMIGVRLPSKISLGAVITTYQGMLQWDLKGGPEMTKQFAEEWLEKNIAAFLGSAANMERFKALSLRVKLHENDDDCPFIYMVAPYASSADRELYIEAIEWKYKKEYGKELKIFHLNDY